jgi:formylglycine-generating enzyme required for sulfatase activity
MNAIANLIKDFNKANEKQEDKKDELTEPETTPASTPVYPEKETWEPVKDSDAPTDVCNLLQAAPPSRITWPKDGAEMVHILAGSFEMGDGKNESEDWMKWSRPVHPVELDGFYIDAYEVTVGQYRKFLSETGHRALPEWVSRYSPTDSHPVVGVNWNDAVAYCRWAGKRLPTEAEWEYVARGGAAYRRYAWGDEIDDTKANYASNVGTTTIVGSYPANGFGLYDVVGNVWEWCSDRYGSDYYTNSPAKNPPGPDIGSYHVLRGGGWNSSTRYLRVANRSYGYPDDRNDHYGFRCVSGLIATDSLALPDNSSQLIPETIVPVEAAPIASEADPKRLTWLKDGSEMALIPGGSFEMGDHFNEGHQNERPVHTVTLDAFYMDVHEVTVGQFREFVNQSGYSYIHWWHEVAKYSPGDEYPMVYVNWNDATAYAKWAGKRLPTEAEWEYAARGGLAGRRYVWGGQEPDGSQCNYADKNAHAFLKQFEWYKDWADLGVNDGYAKCAPVGSFEANGYGLYDMAGNVHEWCQDWYDSQQKYRVLRGGSWGNDTYGLQVADRNPYNPNGKGNGVGFRCVSGLDFTTDSFTALPDDYQDLESNLTAEPVQDTETFYRDEVDVMDILAEQEELAAAAEEYRQEELSELASYVEEFAAYANDDEYVIEEDEF